MASSAPAPVRPSARKDVSAPVVDSTLSAAAVADVLETRDETAEDVAHVDRALRHEMVCTAAYYIAEQRGFVPGHELADWAAAEKMVDARLLSASGGRATS